MAEFDATGSYRAAVGPHSVQRDVPVEKLLECRGSSVCAAADSRDVASCTRRPNIARGHRSRARVSHPKLFGSEVPTKSLFFLA